MADSARWYVIHTYSGYENKVKQNIEKVVENRKLHDLIQEIRIPMESYTEVKDASFKDAADYERCIKAAEAKIEALKKDLKL